MRSYGQYCPIARASEVLAERWTPIILRNLINGVTTFTGLVDWAPGIPPSLLTSRLRDLERVGLVEITPKPDGHGSLYRPTEAAQDLRDVLLAMGRWAEEWLELSATNIDPGFVLHSWCTQYLAVDKLPAQRVVVRFDFPDQPQQGRHLWMLFDGEDSEVCLTHPGFDEDVVVTSDSEAIAAWHLGNIRWGRPLRSGRIRVSGPPRLTRALPTWNRRSAWAHMDHPRAEPADSRDPCADALTVGESGRR